jgi:hypothetical protein
MTETISAIASIITALTALTSVLINAKRIKTVSTKVDDVHTEVRTGNSQTMTQLADAQESRRINKIPPTKRTKLEKSHLTDTT